MSFVDQLPQIDLESLPSIFGEDAKAARSRDARTGLSSDRTHRRRVSRRSMKDARKAANAIDTIRPLPQPGESVTVVMSGLSDGWNYIEAIAKLI